MSELNHLQRVVKEVLVKAQDASSNDWRNI